MKERLDEVEKLVKAMNLKLEAMEAMSSTAGPSEGSGGGMDISKLEKFISSLKADLLKTLVKKEDFEALVKRVEIVETTAKELSEAHTKLKTQVEGVTKQTMDNTEEIKSLMEKIKVLEQKLAGKVNCEEFDRLVETIGQFKAQYFLHI